MSIVATRSGKIEGLERDGIQVFLGIPYAAPPVGELRWRAPRREQPWDGVREATAYSAQSAQTEFALTKMLGGARAPYSEDSLYLNVWTPACDDAKRPVMVWIHGGAYIWGSGDTPWYDGTKFATHGDVVVVTINYRLGPFGYLHLGDLFPGLDGSGNCGLLDQIAALEWVRDCISGFGGDPEQVTIFGESAGASSVGTLLGTPAARGLFHNAIAQSGAAAWYSTRETATAIARELVEGLGVAPGDTDVLLAKTTDEILAAQPEFRENGVNALPYQPVVDGITLAEPPLDAIRNGNADGVHVISGTNAQEMTLFTLADPGMATLTFDEIVARATKFAGVDATEIVNEYRGRRPNATPQDLWLELSTDTVFRMPMIQMLEAQSAHGPVWSYFFTWESPVFGGLLRSTHALEIPFVFDALSDAGATMFTGTGPERQAIADAMHRSWIAFARTGDPNHPDLPAWPAYDTDRRATMRFDTTCEVLDDPGADDRRSFRAALG